MPKRRFRYGIVSFFMLRSEWLNAKRARNYEHGVAINEEYHYKALLTNDKETSCDGCRRPFLQRVSRMQLYKLDTKLGARLFDPVVPGTVADAGPSLCERGGVRGAGESTVEVVLEPDGAPLVLQASSRHGTWPTRLF
jgi:hypothetical protein